MPKPEDEQLNQEGEIPKEKSPEEVAAAAAQKAKEGEAVAVLADAERGGEAEAPVVESAEKDQEARAREIAQRYLETIPEEDRKLTDPKQVERLLKVIVDIAKDDRNTMFSVWDKSGNLPDRIGDARMNDDLKGMAKGWRELAADPVSVAKETVGVKYIANSSLPETVRNAIVLIILKEGDNSVVDMARDLADQLEKGIHASAPEKYRDSLKQQSLRKEATRKLLEGLYPDLVKSDEVTLLLKINALNYYEDRSGVMVMVEQYNQLVGGGAPFPEQFGDIQNGAELLAKLKDGSIPDKGKNFRDASVRYVRTLLQEELKKVIAKKAVSAEAK